MSDLLGLRPYQRDAVAKVEADWAAGVRRPALVMATASGKTLTAAHLIDRHDGPTLFLVHRDELAIQAHQAFTDHGLDVGVVKAEQDDVGRRVIVGSVQTLQNSVRLARLMAAQPTGPLLVVCDEAHHAVSPSWMGVLTALGAFDDQGSTTALGLSATLSRADGSGLGAVWDKISYTYDILDGISEGYLCDVAGQRVTVDGLTLANAKMSGGDFQVTSLSELLSSDDAISATVAAYTEHAATMPGIVFTPDVHSAHLYARAFTAAGYATEAVWGAMPTENRRLIRKRYLQGDVQILVNCMVLTEGTDLPPAQCAVIARPTTNPNLYIQAVGRVLRLFPGKGDALVLDVAGVSADHRLATLADLSSRRITEVKPGETLREAATREVRARNPKLAGYVISTEEIDLFHRSRSVWLQTYEGVWFVPVGDAVVFLWPAKAGDYNVIIRALNSDRWRWVKKGVPLDLAMSWGEEHAEAYGLAWQEKAKKSFGLDRTASWRKSKPSPKMIGYAKSFGIDPPEGVRAGALSCIIDVERTSRVLDPMVRKGSGT